jgi:hypothetical protein
MRYLTFSFLSLSNSKSGVFVLGKLKSAMIEKQSVGFGYFWRDGWDELENYMQRNMEFFSIRSLVSHEGSEPSKIYHESHKNSHYRFVSIFLCFVRMI